MKNLQKLSLVFLSLLALPVFGQSKDFQVLIKNYNDFQKFAFSSPRNLDSALFAAQNVAGRDTKLLNDLIHNSLAQPFSVPFSNSQDSVFYYQLLNILSTSDNLVLANSVKPLLLWIKAKQATGAEEINQIVRQISDLHTQLPRTKSNYTERYAILIQTIAKKHPASSVLSDTLLNQVIARLENLVTNDYFYFQEKKNNEERAYFRFLFAGANYLKALQLENIGKADAAALFFQKASEWSPDESDRNKQHGYLYEMFFLFDSNDNTIFHNAYVERLLKKGSKTEATELLIQIAKADPNYIITFKNYYEKQNINPKPFIEYWREILNEKQKDAFLFQLTLLDGTPFDLAQHKGKWILIDFWGTWCAPCVQELPAMQKFYESIKNQNDVVLVTVACKDTEMKVKDFMQKKAYNFPVVMSDGNVEKMYPVDGYPTKILITPQGKRLRIEFGVDWISRVNTYRKY